ncbi:hypothetical protein [Alloscardovia macacae]|uniref:hypothetical protein n=1 Tax=Alloscardovia macacae TaxID=1160091 RepID=UPI0015D7C0AE|nr:hypothetical protein [Alloscardovia macacae]
MSISILYYILSALSFVIAASFFYSAKPLLGAIWLATAIIWAVVGVLKKKK